MNKEDMQSYVKEMNGLNTDLIVVTGDFVNSKTEEVYPFAEAFSELKAQYGVYGCLGNHDFFAKDVERVAKEVDECGVKLLRNDAVKIHKGSSFVNLLGVDDIGRTTPPEEYFSKAMAFAKPSRKMNSRRSCCVINRTTSSRQKNSVSI
jgi:predicted MPP superfamily phosphohydrolase